MAVFVTASTLDRFPHLATPGRRDAFRQLLCTTSIEHGMEIVAWVILQEHYHVVLVPHQRGGFSSWINALHRASAAAWNREDGSLSRQCWHDYWDRTLWTEGDVISRINYIHHNPVKHGYVSEAAEWCWSSHSDFRAAEGMEDVLKRFPRPLRLPNDDF